MKRTLLALAVVLAPACGHSDADPNLVLQDEASDEAWRAIVDAVDHDLTTESEPDSAHLTTPAGGAVIPASPPFTFTWALPAQRPGPRHGVDDGEFVWLHLEGGGLQPAIDVVSITTTSWTPDADLWARIAATTGPVSVTITNAFMVDGIVMDGPFRSATPTTTFTMQGT